MDPQVPAPPDRPEPPASEVEDGASAAHAGTPQSPAGEPGEPAPDPVASDPVASAPAAEPAAAEPPAEPTAEPTGHAEPPPEQPAAREPRAGGQRGAPKPPGLRGTVQSVDEEDVVVLLEDGRTGRVRKLDLADASGRVAAQAGDKLEVVVDGEPVEGEPLRLKRRQSPRSAALEALADSFASRTPLDGRVTSAIKGGYEVRINGLRAFCPSSQISLRRDDLPQDPVGQTLRFVLTKYDPTGRSLVVSRRKLLEKEQKRLAADTRSHITKGARLEGRVVSFQPYGAFVDLGGIQGLLHVSEISHSRLEDPREGLSLGQSVEVVVLKHDPHFKKVSLSRKALLGDPWDAFAPELAVGKVLPGRIRQVTSAGAFVELAPGVDGLMPATQAQALAPDAPLPPPVVRAPRPEPAATRAAGTVEAGDAGDGAGVATAEPSAHDGAGDVATHDDATHDDATHEGATHEDATHEGATHEGATHEGATHEGTTHEGTTHEGATHEAVAAADAATDSGAGAGDAGVAQAGPEAPEHAEPSSASADAPAAAAPRRAPEPPRPPHVLVGREVLVQVADLDLRRRRVSLAIAPEGAQPGQVLAPPRIEPGARVDGFVERIAPFGVFVRVAPGRTGLLHASESRTPPGTDLTQAFPVGSRVNVEILEISEDGSRIRLSRRTAEERAAQSARAQQARQAPDRMPMDRGPGPAPAGGGGGGAPSWGAGRPESRRGGGRPDGRGERGERGERGGERRGDRRDRGRREPGEADERRDRRDARREREREPLANPAAAPRQGFASFGDLLKQKLESRREGSEATPERAEGGGAAPAPAAPADTQSEPQ